MTAELIRGTFVEKVVDGREVLGEYAYMASRATIFDQDLVNWANKREAELKAKREKVV